MLTTVTMAATYQQDGATAKRLRASSRSQANRSQPSQAWAIHSRCGGAGAGAAGAAGRGAAEAGGVRMVMLGYYGPGHFFLKSGYCRFGGSV